jgi:cell division protein FtsL
MQEEPLPGNSEQGESGNSPEKKEEHHGRRRRRVRKRIRIKKKSSSSKKIKKLAEKIIWTLIIIAFIVTLIFMVRELNVVDEKNKKTKSTSLKFFPVTEIHFSYFS